MSLIDEGHHPWPGPAGSPATTVEPAHQAPREASICGHVAAVEEVLVAEDVAQDPRFADNPLILEKGIRFYAGAPLRTASGMVLGALCVIDTEPRAFADEDRGRLQALADELMVDLAREAAAALPATSRLMHVPRHGGTAPAQGRLHSRIPLIEPDWR